MFAKYVTIIDFEFWSGCISYRKNAPPFSYGPHGGHHRCSSHIIDNNIDTNTGTIALKAEFPNDKDLLWPGQFVQVVLRVTVRENVVVVPTQAVQTGQRGTYVYIAKGNIAEFRLIKAGPIVGDETIIESGVEADEMVVIDGHMRLGPNAPITVRPPTGAPTAPPEKRS